MTDKYKKMFGMKDEGLTEFNTVINDLIPKLRQIADKYNIDTDKMIRFTTYTFITTAFERQG